ncbi:hypothetical protein ACFUN7_15965 [Streptomyces sp. NPDC057236]
MHDTYSMYVSSFRSSHRVAIRCRGFVRSAVALAEQDVRAPMRTPAKVMI